MKIKVRLDKTIKMPDEEQRAKVMLGDEGFKEIRFSRHTFRFAGCEYDVGDDEFRVFDTIGAVKLHYLINKGIASIFFEQK